MMNSELIKRVRTVYDRDRMIDEIEILKNSMYESQGTGFASKLKTQSRYWVAEIIQKETDITDLPAVQEYFGKLLAELKEFKIIKLTLAFEPTEISIDKFNDFVKRNVGEDAILEFEFDPRILGGAQITYEGKFKDLSLRRLFEEEYKEQEVEVMKIIYSK